MSSQNYDYDAASNVQTHIQDNVRTDYTYDANHQLLTETKRNGVLTTSPITYTGVYTYDANGNRITRTVNGVQETYTVDQGDKLLSIAVGGSTIRQYGYDSEGRRTSKIARGQTTIYNWNEDGRLTGMDIPGTTADPTYVYNGIGTRVSRTVNAATTNWKRAGAGVTAAVLNENAIAFTPGISSRDGSTSTFNHAGLKNTDRQSVTTSMNATRQYDAFGNVLNSTGTWQTAFGYAGNFGYQQTDDNLQLLGHRYYDSETGRFISRDPIKDGRNWYGYGYNNPLSLIDPDGLKPGDRFRTLEDLFRDIQEQPEYHSGLQSGKEIGGIIYQNEDGTFGYTLTTETTPQGRLIIRCGAVTQTRTGPGPVRRGGKSIIGTWHTHPNKQGRERVDPWSGRIIVSGDPTWATGQDINGWEDNGDTTAFILDPFGRVWRFDKDSVPNRRGEPAIINGRDRGWSRTRVL